MSQPFKSSGLLVSPDDNIQTPTVSCCHCGRVWLWQPGSGRKRGLCLNCMGYTCGNDACNPCRPVEQLLENIEQGRPETERRILVPVPGMSWQKSSQTGLLLPSP